MLNQFIIFGFQGNFMLCQIIIFNFKLILFLQNIDKFSTLFFLISVIKIWMPQKSNN